MTSFCLETGSEESASAIIHSVSCGSYNNGSLLGLGRLVYLGNFASSLQALNFVKFNRPDVIRCLDCCHADLVFPLVAQGGVHARTASRVL